MAKDFIINYEKELCHRQRIGNKMFKILIVEDDTQMNQAMKLFFTKNGYQVFQAKNCREAGQIVYEEPDIIIADIGLPDGMGIDWYQSLSGDKKAPVIFLTAKDEDEDILAGYDAGCEEYVTKPISPKILLKKVEVILKRNTDSGNMLYYKDLKIDYEKKRVWMEEKEIKLTPKEWKLLELLSRNKGKIITKDLLLNQIWDIDDNYVEEHAVTVSISRLRKKMGKDAEGSYIKNIFGLGYTFGE